MPYHPEIPPITQVGHQTGESFSPVYDDVSWIEDSRFGRTSIEKGHYWKRIYATVVGCGEEFTAKISTKYGVSHTVVEEASDALEISVQALKATLGSKLGSTDLISREDVHEFSRTICAEKCDAVTFAEWQRCDRYQMTHFTRFLKRKKTEVIDVPLNDTQPDKYLYTDRNCCPTKFDDAVRQGYNLVFPVLTEEVTYAVMAKLLSNGKLQLSGIQGIFTPGQIIRTDAFPDFFGPKDEAAVVGLHSLGTVQQFYKLPQTRSGDHIRSLLHRLSWLGFGIAVSLVVKSIMAGGRTAQNSPSALGERQDEFSSENWVPDSITYRESRPWDRWLAEIESRRRALRAAESERDH